jgi:hypothetical protein
MVLMRYAHLPAATTSPQSAMCFVAGSRLRHAEHIGVNEQLSGYLGRICPITSTNACGAVTFGLWLASSSHACHLRSLLTQLVD